MMDIKTEASGILIVGPGTVGEGDVLSIFSKNMPSLRTKDIFAATAPPRFDIFSHHSYPAASTRWRTVIGQGTETEEEEALSDEWLGRP